MGIRVDGNQILLRDYMERDRSLLHRHLEHYCFYRHCTNQCCEDFGHYGFQYPGRTVIPVYAMSLNLSGGGGIHCLTKNIAKY